MFDICARLNALPRRRPAAILAAALAASLWLAGPAAAQDGHYFDGGQRRAITLEPTLVAEFTPAAERSTALAAGGGVVAGDSLMRIVRRPVLVSRAATTREVSAVYREGSSPAGRLMALPGGVLLKFQPDWSRERIDQWLATHQLAVTRPMAQGGNWFFVATPAGQASLDTANRLHDTGELLAALPNWWRQTQAR